MVSTESVIQFLAVGLSTTEQITETVIQSVRQHKEYGNHHNDLNDFLPISRFLKWLSLKQVTNTILTQKKRKLIISVTDSFTSDDAVMAELGIRLFSSPKGFAHSEEGIKWQVIKLISQIEAAVWNILFSMYTILS